MITAAPTLTKIGVVHIEDEVTFRQQYEVARWHKTFKVQPGQTVDLYAFEPRMSYERPLGVQAKAEGVCVSSNFQALFGGMPISGGPSGIDQEVGDIEEVPVFQGTIASAVRQVAAQGGFNWFGYTRVPGIRIELDEDALLLELGVNLHEIRIQEHDLDRKLKIKDVTRQRNSLGRLAVVNFDDLRRLRLLERGEELPKELAGQGIWTLERALSQYEHTRDGVLACQERLAQFEAELLRDYDITVAVEY